LAKGTALEAANVTLDGYTTQGSFYNQTICINSSSVTVLCSTGNEVFFAADIIATNDWNYFSPATAGIIGLARGSPIWNLISNDLTGGYYYAIQFSNSTDWTFAQADYVTPVVGNSISLGLGTG
jgi:hypothetical protein